MTSGNGLRTVNIAVLKSMRAKGDVGTASPTAGGWLVGPSHETLRVLQKAFATMAWSVLISVVTHMSLKVV